MGCSDIAIKSINYVIERHFFNNGAVYIDAQDTFTTQRLLVELSKKLHLLSSCKEDIIELLQNKKMVIMVDECAKLIE